MLQANPGLAKRISQILNQTNAHARTGPRNAPKSRKGTRSEGANISAPPATHSPTRCLPSSGSDFEDEIRLVCEFYLAHGIARLEKVDPPTRTFRGPGGATRTVLLPSPFLDFTGCWTEYGGRCLQIECKKTERPRLEITLDDAKKCRGIKASQIKQAVEWWNAGAITAFLWKFDGEIRLLTPQRAIAPLTAGKSSIPWAAAQKILPGRVANDFLAMLSGFNPTPPKTTT